MTLECCGLDHRRQTDLANSCNELRVHDFAPLHDFATGENCMKHKIDTGHIMLMHMKYAGVHVTLSTCVCSQRLAVASMRSHGCLPAPSVNRKQSSPEETHDRNSIARRRSGDCISRNC